MKDYHIFGGKFIETHHGKGKENLIAEQTALRISERDFYSHSRELELDQEGKVEARKVFETGMQQDMICILDLSGLCGMY